MTDYEEEFHPFHRRGEDLKKALYALTSEGPASWEAIFAIGRTLGLADATMRRAVNEAVNLGVLEKSGGKGGRNAGRPLGPPMVHLTEVGRRWFLAVLNPEYLNDEPCDTCGQSPTRITIYGRECQRCDEIPEADIVDDL